MLVPPLALRGGCTQAPLPPAAPQGHGSTFPFPFLFLYPFPFPFPTSAPF